MLQRTLGSTGVRQLLNKEPLLKQLSSCGVRSFTASPPPKDDYDVIIVGGGMVGAALACALGSAPLTQHLRTALVDSQPMPVSPPPGPVPDARVSAVNPATVRLFQSVGAWEAVVAHGCAPFNTMQVWDSAGPGFVRYEASEVGAAELGFVVENNALLSALHRRLQDLGTSDFVSPVQVQSLCWPGGQVQSSGGKAEARHGNWAEVELANGRQLRAPLVVGADGGRSRVRDAAGIGARGWRYDQRAVIATVQTERAHATAWQRFLPTGPLALLPLKPYFSNIVWSTSEAHARELESMDSDSFAKAVNRALANDFGPPPPALFQRLPDFLPALPDIGADFEKPPTVVDGGGKRASFPLSLVHAHRYAGVRVALVGDAAHTVHPLAGQGVNLGFGDAEALARTVARAVSVGQDIGEVTLLKEYESERRQANSAMMGALDLLQKTFLVGWTPFAAARNAGLMAVHVLKPIKQRIISFAMG